MTEKCGRISVHDEARLFACVLACLVFMISIVAFAAGQRLTAGWWRLDDVAGKDYALYAGDGYRGAIDPHDRVASLDDLERRVGQLPRGTHIIWSPAKRDPSLKPLLFGQLENGGGAFAQFCRDHGISLAINSPACTATPDCAAYCKGAGEGKECRADGLPNCNNNHQCQCVLTCL